jgi:hypothetical protein
LRALEYWLRVVPEAVIPQLPQILPSLNDYLLIDAAHTADEQKTTKDKKVHWLAVIIYAL